MDHTFSNPPTQRSSLLAGLLLCIAALSATTCHSFAADPIADGDLVLVGNATDPTRRIYYVNGLNTKSDRALEQATQLSKQVGDAVTLAYVDCSNLASVDLVAIAVTKVGDIRTELNPAADILLEVVHRDIEEGRNVNLVGYSLGGAVIQNAVNGLGERLRKTGRKELLSKISVVLLGAAVFSCGHPLSDGFPDGLRGLFRIDDACDPISRVVGAVDEHYFSTVDERHSFGGYLSHFTIRRSEQHGRLLLDNGTVLVEEVHKSSQPTDRVVRWRVWNILGQESRRSMNARIPRDWRRVSWSVTDCDKPLSIRFAFMDDVPFWFDDAVLEDLRSGSTTDRKHGDYIGRVVGLSANGSILIAAKPA